MTSYVTPAGTKVSILMVGVGVHICDVPLVISMKAQVIIISIKNVMMMMMMFT
jgi:hypothetical protein